MWRVILQILRSQVIMATLVHFAFNGVAQALARLLLRDINFYLRYLGEKGPFGRMIFLYC